MARSRNGKKTKQFVDRPLVSIGMPLYDEECYLSEALESLLKQDFSNFEIIISDNASIDKTSEISKQYAEKDSRIRYYRNEKNIGEIRNFNRVFELSKGKYFMWAAGHDLWDKTFLAKCVDVMENNPLVAACYSFDRHIGTEGKSLGINDVQLDTRGDSRLIGFVKAIWVLHDTIIFGLMRSENLGKTRLYIPVQGLDHVVRVELSLTGSLAQIKEPLFSLRLHKQENPQEALRRRLRSYSEFKKLPWLYMNLPHMSTVYEYGRGVQYILSNSWEKIIYTIVAYLVGGLRYSKVIIGDIIRLPYRFLKDKSKKNKFVKDE